jgi:hypothetical protein
VIGREINRTSLKPKQPDRWQLALRLKNRKLKFAGFESRDILRLLCRERRGCERGDGSSGADDVASRRDVDIEMDRN